MYQFSTCITALGKKDPCQDIHKFSNGLKNGFTPSLPMEHSITVQSSEMEVLNNNPCLTKDWPQYQSELHLQKKSKLFEDEEDLEKLKKKKTTCKVLLLFSEDGVPASDIAIDVSKTVDHEECRLEVFRLNEATLWYEILTNPEACCMKWTTEADYIMPILTPKFLQEIHRKIDANHESGLLPTSPVLNK